MFTLLHSSIHKAYNPIDLWFKAGSEDLQPGRMLRGLREPDWEVAAGNRVLQEARRKGDASVRARAGPDKDGTRGA